MTCILGHVHYYDRSELRLFRNVVNTRTSMTGVLYV